MVFTGRLNPRELLGLEPCAGERVGSNCSSNRILPLGENKTCVINEDETQSWMSGLNLARCSCEEA